MDNAADGPETRNVSPGYASRSSCGPDTVRRTTMSSMGQAPPTVPPRAAPHRSGRVRRGGARVLATLLGTVLAASAAVALDTSAASAATVDTSAWYVLVNRNTGKVLDIGNRSTADGAVVQQWTDLNGTNQQFRLADSDSGYVRLINGNSGKAVEVQN